MGVRKAKGNDTFDFVAYVLHETSAAYLLTEQGPDESGRIGQWFPKSITEKGERKGAGLYEFTAPEWIVSQKGFI